MLVDIQPSSTFDFGEVGEQPITRLFLYRLWLIRFLPYVCCAASQWNNTLLCLAPITMQQWGSSLFIATAVLTACAQIACGSHTSALCTLINESSFLPLSIQCRKVAHFNVTPKEAKIKPGKSQVPEIARVVNSFWINCVSRFSEYYWFFVCVCCLYVLARCLKTLFCVLGKNAAMYWQRWCDWWHQTNYPAMKFSPG